MVPMKARASFSNEALATDDNRHGEIVKDAEFNAPSADLAKRLEAEGVAVRVKQTEAKPQAKADGQG